MGRQTPAVRKSFAKLRTVRVRVMDDPGKFGPDGLDSTGGGAEGVDAGAEINELIQPAATLANRLVDVAAVAPERTGLHRRTAAARPAASRDAMIIKVSADRM
jgi:hypothetical protein